MKKLDKVNLITLIYSVIILVLGLCLIISPNTAILTICYLLGAFIILSGVLVILNYIFYRFENFGIVNGVCQILFGVVFVFLAKYFVSPLVFSIIVGTTMLISGLLKIQNCIDAKKMNLKYYWVYMIYSVVLVIFAVVLLINPFNTTAIFLRVLGVFLLIHSVMNVLTMIFVSGKVRNVKIIIKKAIDSGTNIEIE